MMMMMTAITTTATVRMPIILLTLMKVRVMMSVTELKNLQRSEEGSLRQNMELK